MMKPGTCLAAWLYRVTRRTSVDVVRRESSRQQREQIAVEIAQTHADGANWDRLESVLDDAMETLGEADRNALLLRFFQNKNLREVGCLLGISEDAAQKRVSRAIEKLRESLGRRKVPVSGTALAALLSAHLASAAPAGLGATIAASDVSAWVGIPQVAALQSTKVVLMTTTNKILITASITAAIGTGFYEARRASTLARENQSLRQQQAPIAQQAQPRGQERESLERDLELAREQIAKLNRDGTELLKLRAQVARLGRNADSDPNADPDSAAYLKSLSVRLAQLKKRLDQSPNQKIPELRFITEKDWLDGAKDADTDTEEGMRQALSKLRSAAKTKVAQDLGRALGQYTRANNGDLPTELSQLSPFVELALDDTILQRYRFTRRGNVKDLAVGNSAIEEASLADEYDNRFLVGPDGYGYLSPVKISPDGKGHSGGFYTSTSRSGSKPDGSAPPSGGTTSFGN